MTMRQYLRHPSDVPIAYRLGEIVADRGLYLRNIGKGGLCFLCRAAIAPGAGIHVEIPVAEPVFKADGVVVWCEPTADCYEVGVRFEGLDAEYGLRMVEQICQIEHYRHEIFKSEGRVLNSEAAALEWIEKFAARFPE